MFFDDAEINYQLPYIRLCQKKLYTSIFDKVF